MMDHQVESQLVKVYVLLHATKVHATVCNNFMIKANYILFCNVFISTTG